MTANFDRPPSVEQLTQIQNISEVMYGQRMEAFRRHGQPSTRAEASELIRQLDAERGSTVHGIDVTPRPRAQEEEPVPDEKTCRKCGNTKPFSKFGKDKRTSDGRAQTCADCKSKNRRGRRSKSSSNTPVEGAASSSPPGKPPAPSTATPNGDWRDRFRDPRLSELEQLQEIIETASGNRLDFSLEETADFARRIAEVF